MTASPVQRVLVTGCSRGIGRATAGELTARGHEVIATARQRDTLDDLDVAHRLALDVTDEDSVKSAIAQVGPVDVLVNNAGLTMQSPVELAPVSVFRDVLETNVLGSLQLIQAVLPGMREQQHGLIVNVSSVFGRMSWPMMGFYSASKFAIEALTEALHYEVGHFGIRTALIEPGHIRPGMQGPSFGADSATYEPLYRAVDASFNRPSESADGPGPEVVAAAIADLVEQPVGSPWPLRVPVGPEAELALGARNDLDDASFETALRDLFEFRW